MTFFHTGCLSLVVAAGLMSQGAFAQEGTGGDAVRVMLDSPRQAFYRDETVQLRIRIMNSTTDAVEDARIELTLPGVLTEQAEVGTLAAGAEAVRLMRFPAHLARAGQYPLRIAVLAGADVIGSLETRLALAECPNPDRMPVWLWPHQAFLNQTYAFGETGRATLDWWSDLGFNTFTSGEKTDGGGPVTPEMRRAWDYALTQGWDVSILLHGGLHWAEDVPSEAEDVRFKIAPDKFMEERGRTIANPFHPDVAAWQNEGNRRIMEVVRDYPQVTTAFVNTEVIDYVRINRNPRGLAHMRDHLGFTELSQAEPAFVAPGVLSDDDDRYRMWKYEFKQGKGVAMANQRAAAMVDRYRPDILVINDPYRSYPLLDGFPGVDVIGSWTYTYPDPKLMLYVETLRAVSRDAGKIPLSTVTMLTSPGQLSTSDGWMMLGPDRLAEVTWINLSRAPRMLCYYVSSTFDPMVPGNEPGDFRMPPETFAKIRELSQRVIEPFGPLLRNTHVAPRRVAVLSSGASELYNGIQHVLDDGTSRLLGHYPNMQIYHLYTLLAMAHIPADVVLDETVERQGLAGYDVLFIPRGRALTETVYEQVLAFQRRGGAIVADQHLEAQIPGVIRLDFDFHYRAKVTAKAIAAGNVFEGLESAGNVWLAALESADAVTALDDQRIMERYAQQLREKLDAHIQREVDCDSPRVLLNMLEGHGVRYLVVSNDERV